MVERVGSAYTIVLGRPLSPREREVMLYTALGWTAVEIGSRLFIDPDTVKNHRCNSYIKLGVLGGAPEAVALLLITDLDFYNKAREAILAEKDKSNGKGRGGFQPGGFGWKEYCERWLMKFWST
jgi:DNA-binding CsgD family transcriptional regulator